MQPSPLLYPTGKVKQTRNALTDTRDGMSDVFSLADVLGDVRVEFFIAMSGVLTVVVCNRTLLTVSHVSQTRELTLALLSTFVANWAWLYAQFPPLLPVIIAAQPDQLENGSVTRIFPSWLRYVRSCPKLYMSIKASSISQGHSFYRVS